MKLRLVRLLQRLSIKLVGGQVSLEELAKLSFPGTDVAVIRGDRGMIEELQGLEFEGGELHIETPFGELQPKQEDPELIDEDTLEFIPKTKIIQ